MVLIGDVLAGVELPNDLLYEDLIAGAEPLIPDEPEEDDLAVLMYTGGTTGLPKGVMLDHRAEMLNLYHIALKVGLDEDSVYLHQTPMFHAASMGGIVGTPSTGGQSVFLPLFDPGPAMELIERHQVTMTVMVPTMIDMMLDHPEFRPERLVSMLATIASVVTACVQLGGRSRGRRSGFATRTANPLPPAHAVRCVLWPETSCVAIGTSRGRPRRLFETAGIAPATPTTSMTMDTSSWSTG